jgi:hypothetical protein
VTQHGESEKCFILFSSKNGDKTLQYPQRAVRRWLFTTELLVQCQVSSCEIHGGLSGPGADPPPPPPPAGGACDGGERVSTMGRNP